MVEEKQKGAYSPLSPPPPRKIGLNSYKTNAFNLEGYAKTQILIVIKQNFRTTLDPVNCTLLITGDNVISYEHSKYRYVSLIVTAITSQK